jgi:hypothetical protein
MSERLPEYSVVEVVKLDHPAEHYDGWKLNKRAPAIGDRGVIVEILRAGGQLNYIVESSRSDGVTEWLGDFSPDEIQAVRTAG